MTDVVLHIGGRDYAVACEAGEEGHVRALGGLIDDKLRAMPGAAAQGESRSLLFAALLLADELDELRGQAQPGGDADAPALATIAQRLEKLASHLETRGHNA